MKLNLEFTELVSFDLSSYVNGRSKSLRRNYNRIRMILFFIALCFLIAFIALYLNKREFDFGMLLLAIPFVIFPFMYRSLIEKSLRKGYRGGKGEDNYSIEIQANQFLFANNKSTLVVEASKIKRVVEVENYFFLDLSETDSRAIPKYQLEDEEAVREALKSTINPYQTPYIEKMNWDNRLFSKNNRVN